ncbi:MAG: SH3 domain-containing protein [Clostridiales bacterium]|nr:SH3 domain-containing protein [Clostridiales bacterium]
MKFIFNLLFIILLCFSAFLYFYSNKKISALRKQLFLTTKQYNTIKNRYISSTANNIVSIKYYIPTYKTGILSNNSNLHIAPTNTSQILRVVSSNTQVSILDSSEVNNELWYYINLPTRSNVNCRGWIKSKDFSIFSEEIYNK